MPQDLTSICLIIPAYNPDRQLVGLVGALHAMGFGSIVVVDDGSAASSAAVFEAIAPQVQLVRHAHNRGKGAALKTAFEHVLQAGHRHAITLDADGQHLPEDVRKLALAALASEGTEVLLGAREMRPDAPWRSRVGNRLTRWMFSKLAGQYISDTQTGLRAFPTTLLPQLLRLEGERYEYEMHMLSHLVRRRVPLREIPITTVYVDDNASSHFNPLLDSLRIYWVLFKDLIVAGSSLLLDLALFAALLHATRDVFLSVIGARVLSGLFNFAGNRLFVFRGQHAQRLLPQLCAYGLLAGLLMLSSAVAVDWLVGHWRTPPLPTKMAVDALLYLVSFQVRRNWLFRLRGSID